MNLYYIVIVGCYVNCIIIRISASPIQRCRIMLKHRFFTVTKNSLPNDSKAPRLFLILACFAVGCVLGAFFGSIFSTADFIGYELLPLSDDSGFFNRTFRFVRFHLFAILLGTSFLGVFFIPVLTMLNGFLFSCASATIITAYPSGGIIMSLIILCVPSLFSIPCFIALCDDAFFRSARLLSLFRGRCPALGEKKDKSILFCLPVLAAGAVVDFELVPYLLTLIH